MFLGVLARGKVVLPPVRNMRLYGALYDDLWLWRYNDANMDPRHERFLQSVGEIFFNDPLRIRSSVRKCNKKYLPGGVEIHHPPGWGGTTLFEFALVSEKVIKKFCLVGGGVEIHPTPPKYYAAEVALTLLLQCLLIYRKVIGRNKSPKALLIWDSLDWKSSKLVCLGITTDLIFYCVAVNIHCCIFVKKCPSTSETIRVSYKNLIVPGCANGSILCIETLI